MEEKTQGRLTSGSQLIGDSGTDTLCT